MNFERWLLSAIVALVAVFLAWCIWLTAQTVRMFPPPRTCDPRPAEAFMRGLYYTCEDGAWQGRSLELLRDRAHIASGSVTDGSWWAGSAHEGLVVEDPTDYGRDGGRPITDEGWVIHEGVEPYRSFIFEGADPDDPETDPCACRADGRCFCGSREFRPAWVDAKDGGSR